MRGVKGGMGKRRWKGEIKAQTIYGTRGKRPIKKWD